MQHGQEVKMGTLVLTFGEMIYEKMLLMMLKGS